MGGFSSDIQQPKRLSPQRTALVQTSAASDPGMGSVTAAIATSLSAAVGPILSLFTKSPAQKAFERELAKLRIQQARQLVDVQMRNLKRRIEEEIRTLEQARLAKETNGAIWATMARGQILAAIGDSVPNASVIATTGAERVREMALQQAEQIVWLSKAPEVVGGVAAGSGLLLAVYTAYKNQNG
ncbi:gp53 [Salisaeta icosahedral phage 1]|uniref:gp53 n=1 Tax=Salisaeta icosahedral phage 1 TaxID=1183239 RepID=UPI00025EA942|nr:gp53 [Salisaeta icosahedral phage 1]AFJ21508.1 gp53 [Salisaeta icosahedral phage 1]